MTEVAATADSVAPASEANSSRRERDSKLALPPDDVAMLVRLSRSHTASHRIVRRSRLLLALALGKSEREIAREQGVSRAAVRRGRQRYLEAGLSSVLRDRPGRGRRSSLPGDVVARVQTAARTMAARGERATLRRLARELNISYAALQRLNARHAGLLADVSVASDSASPSA